MVMNCVINIIGGFRCRVSEVLRDFPVKGTIQIQYKSSFNKLSTRKDKISDNTNATKTCQFNRALRRNQYTMFFLRGISRNTSMSKV